MNTVNDTSFINDVDKQYEIWRELHQVNAALYPHFLICLKLISRTLYELSRYQMHNVIIWSTMLQEFLKEASDQSPKQRLKSPLRPLVDARRHACRLCFGDWLLITPKSLSETTTCIHNRGYDPLPT